MAVDCAATLAGLAYSVIVGVPTLKSLSRWCGLLAQHQKNRKDLVATFNGIGRDKLHIADAMLVQQSLQ